MKAFLCVLFPAFVLNAMGQADTSKRIQTALTDSAASAYTIPSPRYLLGLNPFTTNKNTPSTSTSDHKVQLYWDPAYMKLVPFKVQSNYKEGWLSGAATLAAQALFPYKKVER